MAPHERRIAAIIHCGGHGTRAGFEKKPLVLLPGGDRPLTNILRDLPASIPIYLHLLREQKEPYADFLTSHGAAGHAISYLPQQLDRLYAENRLPLARPDGTCVLSSNGPGTFARQFVNAPDYFLSMDGSKSGIRHTDVLAAISILEHEPSVHCVTFAFMLTDSELAEEVRRYEENGRTRWARLHERKQEVYEYPYTPNYVVDNKEWLAVDGVHVLRARNYIKHTAAMKGEFMPAHSIDGLHDGYAYTLKVTTALYGFNKRPTGLTFRIYNVGRHIPGIKTMADVQHYPKLQQSGLFDYRRSL